VETRWSIDLRALECFFISAQPKKAAAQATVSPSAGKPTSSGDIVSRCEAGQPARLSCATKEALVRHLSKEDFVLQVDRKPRAIRYFDIDANLPLTLGLLVDTSLSQQGVIDEERSASGTFLDQRMKSGKDQAFIVRLLMRRSIGRRGEVASIPSLLHLKC